MKYTDQIDQAFIECIDVYPAESHDYRSGIFTVFTNSSSPSLPRARRRMILEHVIRNTELFDEDIKNHLTDPKPLSPEDEAELEEQVICEMGDVLETFTVYPTIHDLIKDQFANPEFLGKDSISDEYMDLFHLAISLPNAKTLLDRMLELSNGVYLEDANVFLRFH